MRNADDKYRCPLFNKDIYWSMCYSVQEIRDDNMDMDLFSEPFDVEEANEKCEKCRWCYVND